MIYAGPAHWIDVRARGFEPAPLDDLRDQARQALADGAWFGAAAAAPDSTAPVVLQGFASLAGAETAALQLCATTLEGCQIIAQLVPQDFDARRTGTTSAAQGAAWTEFRTAPRPLEAPHRALATSLDGGAGWADADAAARANRQALARCGAAQTRMGHPQGTVPMRCHAVAWVTP
jgi:hypothetical protein